jgi:excisionase family DNA binding protein
MVKLKKKGAHKVPEPEEIEPLLYDVDQACRILGGISKPMVYRLVQTGELRPVKVGSRSMFTMEELQRFVRENQVESPA